MGRRESPRALWPSARLRSRRSPQERVQGTVESSFTPHLLVVPIVEQGAHRLPRKKNERALAERRSPRYFKAGNRSREMAEPERLSQAKALGRVQAQQHDAHAHN